MKSKNVQKPWRTTKGWEFPYTDPVWEDKQYLRDRSKLFRDNGNGWWIELWNRIW